MPDQTSSCTYIDDIIRQPRALRAALRAVPAEKLIEIAISIRAQERIVLTGMGASFSALLPAWRKLVEAGLPAWHLDTADLLSLGHRLLTSRTLVIAASQSGRSAEVVTLAAQVRRDSLIAITTDPASPLARAAGRVLEIHAGEERAVSTCSYLNTLAIASALAAAVTTAAEAESWRNAPDAIERYLETWRLRVDALKEQFGLPERLVLLARGASLAAATYGALIIKEAAKWPVEAMSAAQFRHGPLELADARLTVPVFAGDELQARERNRRLAQDIARFGGNAWWIDSEKLPGLQHIDLPGVSGAALAAAEIIPLQLLSVALAELTGIEPGAFRHLQKVTTVE